MCFMCSLGVWPQKGFTPLLSVFVYSCIFSFSSVKEPLVGKALMSLSSFTHFVPNLYNFLLTAEEDLCNCFCLFMSFKPSLYGQKNIFFFKISNFSHEQYL